MNEDKSHKLIEDLKKSIDLLVLIELCKAGTTRNQARKILGTLNNNTFAEISTALGRKKQL